MTMLNGEGSRVVEDAGCGLTANSCDYKTLAENVKKLYSISKEERSAMGAAGRTYYDKVFAKELVIDKVNEILKDS